MNAPVQLTMDKATFLRWAEGREGHYELKRNVVVMMTGASRNHSRVTKGIMSALDKRLDPIRHEVMPTDLAVETGDGIRYPDVIVDPAADLARIYPPQPRFWWLRFSHPLQSHSTSISRPPSICRLPPLEAYVVAAQDEPRLWIWNRGTGPDRAWPRIPLEVHGKDKQVPVSCFAIELPMAEIYAAIPDQPA